MMKGQRCVILADGFYEWKKEGKDKQPFFIYFPQCQTTNEELIKTQDSSDCEEKTKVCIYFSVVYSLEHQIFTLKQK